MRNIDIGIPSGCGMGVEVCLCLNTHFPVSVLKYFFLHHKPIFLQTNAKVMLTQTVASARYTGQTQLLRPVLKALKGGGRQTQN